MVGLCGKGVWTTHSYDLQRAAEMTTSIEGTHLFIKVGHGPFYFPETARVMIHRVRSLGHHALAWVQINDNHPVDALKAISEALNLGYEAVVLFLGTALVTQSQIQSLAQALDDTEIPTQRLILATPPRSGIPDPHILNELAPLCQGGWMPLCFANWGDSPEEVIDHEVYQTLDEMSLLWDKTPDIYPVLAPHHKHQTTPFLPEEFIPWLEGITRHGVDFFSIYHAANTEKALWPLVTSVNVPCMETAEHPLVEDTNPDEFNPIPQPVYITATSSDTVWGIIIRHGLNKEQFWAWNAHLWDSRSLPRDPDYLQAGWRIRVK